MTQPRYTTGEVASLLGAQLIGPPDLVIHTLAGIADGGPGAITFIRSAKFAPHWQGSNCTAALVSKDVGEIPGHDSQTRALLIVDSADHAMVTLLEKILPTPHLPAPGVHPTAVIDPAATIDPAACVGPCAVVGPGSVVQANAVIAAGVVIGADCQVGQSSQLRPGVVLEDRCTIGDRCLIHANTVIGSDGFGFIPSNDSIGIQKIPHAGIVEIHDDVEIGSNTSIDRSKFASTIIGQGTKIDNLCQIAHNVIIGRSCLIAAGVIFGGSTAIGDGVKVGGHTVIADNLTVGSGSTIGGNAGVTRCVPPGEYWLGFPAAPAATIKRQWIAVKKLPDIIKSLRKNDPNNNAS